MTRFRVVKGGTVLLAVALVLLMVVICIIAFSGKPFSVGGRTADGETSAAVLAAAPASGEIASQVIVTQPKKRVLIYHTHTHEAYQPTDREPYEALEAWRTDDNAHNVVRVGGELARLLEEAGFEVCHDITDHEGTDLTNAYVRSLETLIGYGETFDLTIDLHRDAYAEGVQMTCAYGGVDSAKLMMLVGKGEAFASKPDFETNFALASRLTDAVNAVCPGLCRDVMVKDGRYNQHVSDHSLLIEVGNNRNTLEEALASMPVLAQAIESVLTEE